MTQNTVAHINPLWGILALFCLTTLINQSSTFAMGNSTTKERPDAIILLLEKDYQVDNDGSYTVKVHVKTRINTYQGKKSWADFKISYNSNFERIKVIQAFTITPRGKKVLVTPKEIHDITDPSTQSASLFSASRLKVVNFPSVEEGCTVEMTVEKSSRLGLWAVEPFSLKDPIRLKRVQVSMPTTMHLSVHLKSNEIHLKQKIQGNKKTYIWTGTDRNKIVSEPMMPPIQNRPDTLIFSTLHSWQNVSELFKRLFLSKTNDKNLATNKPNAFLSREDPDAIFVALKKEFEIYPIGLFKSNFAFSSPNKTLARGYGTQFDMILLFRYLLSQKGIKSHVIAVNSAGIWLEGLRDCYDPALFNTFLINARGKFYSFDMKYAAPGITGLDGSIGLDINSNAFVPIKDVVKNETVEKFDFVFATPRSFTASYTGKYCGLRSVSIKRNFRDLTLSEFKVKQSIYYHSLHPIAKPLVPLKITGIDLQSLETNITAKYAVENFQLENHGVSFFPNRSPGILKAFSSLLPDRKNPVFVKRPLTQCVEINVHFPFDVTIIHVPSNTYGSIGPLSWKNICSPKGENLLCRKSISIKRGFVRIGEEYQKIRNIIQGLTGPLDNSIVFQQNP